MIFVIDVRNAREDHLDELKAAAIGIIDEREVVKDRLCDIETIGKEFFIPFPNGGVEPHSLGSSVNLIVVVNDGTND